MLLGGSELCVTLSALILLAVLFHHGLSCGDAAVNANAEAIHHKQQHPFFSRRLASLSALYSYWGTIASSNSHSSKSFVHYTRDSY